MEFVPLFCEIGIQLGCFIRVSWCCGFDTIFRQSWGRRGSCSSPPPPMLIRSVTIMLMVPLPARPGVLPNDLRSSQSTTLTCPKYYVH